MKLSRGALSAHSAPHFTAAAVKKKKNAAGSVAVIVHRGRFAGSGHSLVEEGEQVAHHHQRGPRHAQQDLTDALRPLVHVLDPCGGGKKKKGVHQEPGHEKTNKIEERSRDHCEAITWVTMQKKTHGHVLE